MYLDYVDLSLSNCLPGYSPRLFTFIDSPCQGIPPTPLPSVDVADLQGSLFSIRWRHRKDQKGAMSQDQ